MQSVANLPVKAYFPWQFKGYNEYFTFLKYHSPSPNPNRKYFLKLHYY